MALRRNLSWDCLRTLSPRGRWDGNSTGIEGCSQIGVTPPANGGNELQEKYPRKKQTEKKTKGEKRRKGRKEKSRKRKKREKEKKKRKKKLKKQKKSKKKTKNRHV